MNPIVKAAWVAALRSNEYQQGRVYLRNRVNQFCCLGVLCDLHAKATSTEWETAAGLPEKYLDSLANLPAAVMKWSGITTQLGQLPNGRTLSSLNDDDKLSFAAIADIIEENL